MRLARRAFPVLVALTCAPALGLLGAGTATAAGWHFQGHVEEQGENAGLLGIACPTRSLCVAVGESDAIAASANPDGGASAWRLFHPLIKNEDRAPSPTPPPGFELPESPPTPVAGQQAYRKVHGVSCPSPALCVAVTFDGYVLSSTDPTGGANAWRVADVDGKGRDTHLMAVSCPSVDLCVAVSGDRYTAGKILSSTDPRGGPSSWKVVQLDETLDLRGVSCGSPGFCVAVAREGRLLYSTNPTGGPSAWTEVGKPGGPGNLQGVSCVGMAFCVAGNSGGNLLSSDDPSGGLSSWSEVEGGASVQITGIDCLPSKQCIAVDNNGSVITSLDGTAGRGSWSPVNVIPYEDPAENGLPLNALFGVSCPSTSFCAVSGADGRIYTSEDPFAESSNGSGGGKKKIRKPRRPHVRIATAHAGYRVRTARAKSSVFFRFHANGRVRGFLCARDGHRFRPCHSPVRYKAAVGRHVFKVRAIGLTGVRGPIAMKRFRIVVNPAFTIAHGR